MTFLEVAEMALKQNGHPMKPNEMVALALKNVWLGQVGKPPAATMRGVMVALFVSLTTWSAGAVTLDGWLDDLEEAKSQAKRDGKQILAAFGGSDWCGWCRKMDKDVYAQPDFLPSITNRFVPVFIDSPRNRQLLREAVRERNPQLHREYSIRGVPCTLIIDADGKEIGRVSGYRSGVAAFIDNVNGIKGVAAEKVMTKNGLVDPSEWEDANTTKRTRNALAAMFPDWKLATNVIQARDDEIASGFRSMHRGRKNVFLVHPVDGDSPVVLRNETKLPNKSQCLKLEVASHAWDTDCLLSVRVNGNEVLPPRVICTPDVKSWESIDVPLSRWKGKKVKIEIVVSANGWFFEHAYFGRIEVVDGTGKEQCGPVGIKETEIFPHADVKSAKWRKRKPWAYTTVEPAIGWNDDVGFDDKRWKRTRKSLGCEIPQLQGIMENWQAKRIWLRRTFSWSDSAEFYKATFDIWWDQDVEIYLNGILVLKNGGWSGKWLQCAARTNDFVTALRKGENVLAVTLKGDPPNFFDCGLAIETLQP